VPHASQQWPCSWSCAAASARRRAAKRRRHPRPAAAVQPEPLSVSSRCRKAALERACTSSSPERSRGAAGATARPLRDQPTIASSTSSAVPRDPKRRPLQPSTYLLPVSCRPKSSAQPLRPSRDRAWRRQRRKFRSRPSFVPGTFRVRSAAQRPSRTRPNPALAQRCATAPRRHNAPCRDCPNARHIPSLCLQARMTRAKYLTLQTKNGGGGGNRTRVRVGLIDRVYVRSSQIGFSGGNGLGAGRARCESGCFLILGPPTGPWTSLLLWRLPALADIGPVDAHCTI
jgi:hypothetical protein